MFKNAVLDKINQGENAETAVKTVIDGISSKLLLSENSVMRERVSDINDIKSALINHLCGSAKPSVESKCVVVTKEVLPSFIPEFAEKRVAAVVAEKGGFMSHSAILLRAAKIPAVFGVKGINQIKNGDNIFVNSYKGEIDINSENTVTENIIPTPELPESVRLLANIGSSAEVKNALSCGAQGIGLFRSEFLFLNRASPPGEDEQLYEYLVTAKEAGEKETVIRTLDLGGDKTVPYLNCNKRGVRLCLDNIPLFKTQIRAILRAAVFGNIKIMLPFVTKTEEVETVKGIIETCCTELKEENRDFRRVPLGVMVETPSAVIISDLLSEICDFLSVGTNDLAATIMAEPREEQSGYNVYKSVLRAVKITAENAKKNGVPVTLCGDAAADISLIQKFISCGINSFSLPPGLIKK